MNPNLELEDLRAAWQQVATDQTALRADFELARVRRGLWQQHVSPVLHILVSLAGMSAVGDFLSARFPQMLADPAGAWPTVALMLLGVAAIMASVHQLMAVYALEYASDLRSMLHRTLVLETVTVRGTLILLALGLVGWVALPVWWGQVTLGYGSYRQIPLSWLAANAAFGVAAAGALVILARSQRWSQQVRQAFTGENLTRLRNELRQLES